MKSLRHRLPSLTSLVVFEAAARTLNFTRAAAELHVSQAAVSKQIRLLEDFVGAQLFEREGRRVRLSARGQQLQAKVSASFHFLAEAVEEIRGQPTTTTITVAANTAVSHGWLGEVMRHFRDRHPGFAGCIRTVTSDRTQDLFDEAVDIALAYDVPARAGWTARPLFEEELFPVASPDYIRRHPQPCDSPQALLSHVLLDYERLEPNWINWAAWFGALGVEAARLRPMEYGNSHGVQLDAARRGRGVTLGTRHLVDEDLANGRLQRLSPFSVRSGRSYHLLVNGTRSSRPQLGELVDWLSRHGEAARLATAG
ncbi:MAG: LysR family transcriptional regulator [Pseudomonadota bacterium]|jgi:DNA-binding transcriptional LysR family regulator